MAVRSARLLLERWHELLALRRDFAFESTLSGRTYAVMLGKACAAGYTVHMSYLWLPSVNMSLRRVRERVLKGGHDVPEADVRRRFLPSLRNFFSLYLPLADKALLFNAATRPPRVIAGWQGRTSLLINPELYDYIQNQIETAR
jgi:predicted ABC-type ATPase